MSLRKSRGYKYAMWALTLACLGGAGYLGYRTFFSAVSAEKELKAAEAAYARGLEAYTQKNWGAATERFHEAQLLADKAKDALDTQVKESKLPPDQADPLLGRILWVKARAIRDHVYADSHKPNATPLNEIADPQYKETYRAFVAIPDENTRVEAANALRQATHLLNADQAVGKELVKESLRLELAVTPIDWQVVAPLLRKALEYDPADARANYYLARFEYEQPADNVNPRPYDLRSKDGVDRAREYLAAAKKHGAALWFWRTAGLEAEILAWPIRTAAARKLKADAVAAAEKAVDDVLFDSQAGLVYAAARGEKLAGLGAADTRGLVSVLTVGMERAAADARKPGGSHDRLRVVTQASLDLANKMSDDPTLKLHLGEVGTAVVNLAVAAQPLLSRADPAGWRDYLAKIDALIARAPETTAGGAPTRLQLARIAATDADTAVRANDAARAKELRERTLKEAEAGLKAAESGRLTGPQLDEFHLLLAEVKLQSGGRGEDLEPHLSRLRVSTVPRFKLIGQFFDARVAERRGNLKTARELLRKVVEDRDPKNADVVFQAHVLLAGLAQATSDAAGALAALKEVDAKYNSPDLPAYARTWADQTLGGQDTITGGLVVANLGVALQTRAKYLRENPGKTAAPDELVGGYVNSAAGLLQKLKAPTVGDWVARMAFANYAVATGRRQEAEARLERLTIDYPESIGVLRARCLLLAAPAEPGKPNPNGVAAADLLIRKYTKDFPNSQAARLYFAEWLMVTDRTDEAIKYLNDPASFPGGKDPNVDRLLAAALLKTGQREEAQKILSKLPLNRGVDFMLLQAANQDIGEKLRQNLKRYEDQGTYRIAEATVLMSERKFEESARVYASALEFDRVREAARSGMQTALVAYAEAEPAKGRDAAIRFAADHPDQPGVYVAAAVASLLLEEIGAPGDNWDNVKTTMFAAVNRWEAVSQKAGFQPTDLIAAKVQFYLLAGDPDGAKREAVIVRNRFPAHFPTALLLAELYLLPPADPARAKEFLAAARGINPEDPRLPGLEAAILSSGGDWAGAAKIYEKVAADFPKSPAVYPPAIVAAEKLGNKDAALGWAKKWAEQVPADNTAVTEVVRLTVQTGKKADAVKLADEFVAARAAEARKRAAELVPPPPAADTEKRVDTARANALLAVASGFVRAGEHDLAESRLREALKTHPTADALHLLLGEVALARKDWDKALASYRDILSRDPRHFVAGNNAAYILAENLNKPADALALVEEVRKPRGTGRPVGPERLPPDFLDTIGVVYLKLNDPTRAGEMRSLFEAASRRHPGDPRLLTFYAHGLAASGEVSKAIETFDRAIQLAGGKNSLTEEKSKAAAAAAEAGKKKWKKE